MPRITPLTAGLPMKKRPSTGSANAEAAATTRMNIPMRIRYPPGRVIGRSLPSWSFCDEQNIDAVDLLAAVGPIAQGAHVHARIAHAVIDQIGPHVQRARQGEAPRLVRLVAAATGISDELHPAILVGGERFGDGIEFALRGRREIGGAGREVDMLSLIHIS